ncbi:MAG: nitroreductase family protein [Bacteroidia bacterium]
MNEVIKTIFERRAVRKYTKKTVSKDIIEQILDAGRMAPSAINKQPWKFYIITSPDDIKLFSKEIVKAGLKSFGDMPIKKAAGMVLSGLSHLSHGIDFFKSSDAVFHGAPVVIIITSPKDNEWAALDIGMCSQNIMLAAKSLGLDSCPVGFGKFIERTKDYSKLKISAKETVQLAIIIGYGDEKPELHERIKNNSYYL